MDLHRQQLFKKTAERSLFNDKINFQDPISRIAVHVGIAEFDVIVGVKVIPLLVSLDFLVREVAD